MINGEHALNENEGHFFFIDFLTWGRVYIC